MIRPFHALLVITLLLVPVSLWSTDLGPSPDNNQAAGQPDYQKNDNQTITDQQSGLMWIASNMDIQRRWQDAVSYCNELVFADQTDWRLPSKLELESIVDYDRFDPAMNPAFSCQSSFYWSSTPHTTNPAYAWSVFCPDGADHWVHKSNNYEVRCVRSNPPSHAIAPYTPGIHTVIDQGTGLEWQKNDNNTLHTWQNARDHCETLSLDAKTDWRLPNIRELKSLVDYNRYYPATDPSIPCQSSSYWSATTVANDAQTSAWSIFFGNGDDLWSTKTARYHVRCVRTNF